MPLSYFVRDADTLDGYDSTEFLKTGSNIFTGDQYVSGSLYALNSVHANDFTGSLTRIDNGVPYILAGPDITITTNSLGQIEITGSSGAVSSQYWQSDVQGNIFTTDSVYVSGTMVASNDIFVNGNASINGVLVSSGSATIDGFKGPGFIKDTVTDGSSYGFIFRNDGPGNYATAGFSLVQENSYVGGIAGMKNTTQSGESAGLKAGLNLTFDAPKQINFRAVAISGGTTKSIGVVDLNGLQITGSANISNGINIAAGGLQVAGNVTGINAPYDKSPLIIDLASGQYYGPVIRSAIGQYNYSGLSFDQAGTYLGGIYNITNNPNNGYVDGMNISTTGGRKIGFFVNGTTAVAKITSDGLQVTGSINASSTITATTGFSGSLTTLANGSSYLLAGPNIILSTGSTGQIQISGSASGTSGQVQFNNGGLFGGATNVSIGDGDLILVENTSPTTPGASTVKLHAQPVAGREMLTSLGTTGRAYTVQPHQGRSKYGIWMINGGSISLTAEGIGAANGTGTVTARTPTLTGFASSLRRVGFVTATTANAPAGWRLGATWFWRGDNTNRGGFHYITRFIPSNATTTLSGRYFIGMNGANTGTAATEPSNWVNIIGMGCNSGSVNFSIMHNDASGSATTIDLGSNFSAVSSSIDVYELALYCPPNGSSVEWRVENFTKNAVTTGSITTNLPASTQGLNLLGYTETGGGVAVALDLVSMYIETEF